MTQVIGVRGFVLGFLLVIGAAAESVFADSERVDGLNDYSASETYATTVLSTNGVPVANPQMITTSEAFALPLALTGSDPENEDLTFAIDTFPSNGSLMGIPPAVTYTGNTGFIGSDSFTFTVSDGISTSLAATVTVTVVENMIDRACGRPIDLDRTVDRGTFLWRGCDDDEPLWFLQTNGGGVLPEVAVAGRIEAMGGLLSLNEVSIENADSLDASSDTNVLSFVLRVKRSGVDRLEFAVPVGACLIPESPADEPYFLGADRTPLETDSFSLDNGLDCQPNVDNDGDGLTDAEELELGTNPLIPDTDGGTVNDGQEVLNGTDPLDPSDDLNLTGQECLEPTIDRTQDLGFFLWSTCDGTDTWEMRASGGGTDTRFEFTGRVETPNGVTDLRPFQLGTNDVLNESVPNELNYTFVIRNNDIDGAGFTVDDIAACFIYTGPEGLPIFLGRDRVPLAGNTLDLINMGACMAPVDTDLDGLSDDQEMELGTNPLLPDTDGGSVNDGIEVERGTDPLDPNDDLPTVDAECFAPSIDLNGRTGVYAWKACDGTDTWSVEVAAGGNARVIFEGSVSGSMPVSLTSGTINGNDTLTQGAGGVSFRLINRPGGSDRFSLQPQAGSCLVIDTPQAPILVGEGQTPIAGNTLNLDDPTEPCGVKNKILAELNRFRAEVDPPCDPQQPPCDATPDNKLPTVIWDEELAAASASHVATCPLFFALPSTLPEGVQQMQYLFPIGTDANTLIDEAFEKFNFDGDDYDPFTGLASNGDALAYKALVNGNLQAVGGALKTDCKGGPTGVFSVFHLLVRPAPPEGPAYPALVEAE